MEFLCSFLIRRALSIFSKLWGTSMERSIEWRTCSIWHKFHSFMLSSPKFKMVAQISTWKPWNWWFLAKTRKWNIHFHRKSFLRENRTTFSIFQLFPGIFQWNAQKKYVQFRIHPNRNRRNFLVNGKRPSFRGKTSGGFPKCRQFSQAKAWEMKVPQSSCDTVYIS